MPEEIETRSEERIEEKPKADLFDKIKIHKWKILGGILGIFVFAGVIFGAYKLGQRQIQPTPQPTPTPAVVATPIPAQSYYITEGNHEGWSKLTNQTYHYSIEFPAEWFVDESGTEMIIFSYDPERVEIPGLPVSGGQLKVEIIPEKNPDKLPLFEFATAKGFTSKENIVSSEESIISGEKALKVVSKGWFDLRYQTILVQKGIDVIVFQGWGGSLDKHKQTFNLMLSTFRFLE